MQKVWSELSYSVRKSVRLVDPLGHRGRDGFPQLVFRRPRRAPAANLGAERLVGPRPIPYAATLVTGADGEPLEKDSGRACVFLRFCPAAMEYLSCKKVGYAPPVQYHDPVD